MVSALVILGFAERGLRSEETDVAIFSVVGSCGEAIVANAVSEGDMIVTM